MPKKRDPTGKPEDVPDPKKDQILIRCTSNEKAEWQEMAWEKRLSLSALIRKLLDREKRASEKRRHR